MTSLSLSGKKIVLFEPPMHYDVQYIIILCTLMCICASHTRMYVQDVCVHIHECIIPCVYVAAASLCVTKCWLVSVSAKILYTGTVLRVNNNGT